MPSSLDDNFVKFISLMWDFTYDKNKMINDSKYIQQSLLQLTKNNIGNFDGVIKELKKTIGRYYLLNKELTVFIKNCHASGWTPCGSSKINDKFISLVELTVSEKFDEQAYINKANTLLGTVKAKSRYSKELHEELYSLSASFMLSYSMLLEFINNFNKNMRDYEPLHKAYLSFSNDIFDTWLTLNAVGASHYYVNSLSK